MKIKIGLFAGNKLIQDRQKKDCLIFTALEPINDECEFDFYQQIELDLKLICSIYQEEELRDSYVYLAYYKEDKSLFGWNVAKLLEQNAVGGSFAVKSGIYKMNMLDPPG